MIYDVFTYNGEADILEIRLNILNDYVDEFIIVEAPTTFSGREKPLYGLRDMDRFKYFWHKIKYHVIDENYTDEEIMQAESSPNTKGAEHWKREFLQKESIKKALTHLKDDDIVFIGDVDEIWIPEMLETGTQPIKLKLSVYTYFLNNRSDEEFWGTVKCRYKDIKNECLNHFRTHTRKTDFYGGYHFTSMGGYEEVRRKLMDSYTRESYWTEGVEKNLEFNIKNQNDFLGRGFYMWIEDIDLPDYILDNREKYKHLFYDSNEK